MQLKNDRTPWITIVPTFTILAIMVWLLFTFDGSDSQNKADAEGNPIVNTADWYDYESAEFGFSVKYPKNWKVSVLDDDSQPGISFYYEPEDMKVSLPLSQSDNVTNISIYPRGHGFSDIGGPSEHLSLGTHFPFKEPSTTYLLRNGIPFAASIVPDNSLATWNQAGFVWVRGRVNNLSIICGRGESAIDGEGCGDVTSNDFVRDGIVDEEEWLVAVTIIDTLRFKTEQ
jgi:hypothetical protein